MNTQIESKEKEKPLLKKFFTWLWSLIVKFYKWRKAWGKEKVTFEISRNLIIRGTVILLVLVFVSGVYFATYKRIGWDVNVIYLNDPATEGLDAKLLPSDYDGPINNEEQPFDIGKFHCTFDKWAMSCEGNIHGISEFSKTNPFP